MPVNHVVLASGAVAVTVVVAAAVAIYESPEFRRYSDDVRRRVAMALQQLGEGINPPSREPRFNRPEDADGFMLSRRQITAEPGVDADDESRRRQREELMYWNSVRLQNKDGQRQGQLEEQSTAGQRPDRATSGRSFDDFVRPADDPDAEDGAYVYYSGREIQEPQAGLRHRGGDSGARGLAAASLYANPFADEYHIDHDDVELEDRPPVMPGAYETSDIYSATTREDIHETAPASETDGLSTPALIDIADSAASAGAGSEHSQSTLERELAHDEFMTAGQDDQTEAYASIQAWAQDSSRNFYSPLPETPVAPISEPEALSDAGDLTPTDSMSIIGSGDDIAHEVRSMTLSGNEDNGRPYDVMSESEGMLTPASWSEVGSVVSDNDAGQVHEYTVQDPRAAS